jgi:hypothetical protein
MGHKHLNAVAFLILHYLTSDSQINIPATYTKERNCVPIDERLSGTYDLV